MILSRPSFNRAKMTISLLRQDVTALHSESVLERFKFFFLKFWIFFNFIIIKFKFRIVFERKQALGNFLIVLNRVSSERLWFVCYDCILNWTLSSDLIGDDVLKLRKISTGCIASFNPLKETFRNLWNVNRNRIQATVFDKKSISKLFIWIMFAK